MLRQDFGTTNESYLSILSHCDSRHNLDVWEPEIGGISQWYVAGKPICSSDISRFGIWRRTIP